MNDIIMHITSWCGDSQLLTLFSCGIDVATFARSDQWWLLRISNLLGKSISVSNQVASWKNVYHSLLYVLNPVILDNEQQDRDPYLHVHQAPVLHTEIATVEIMLQVFDPTRHGYTLLCHACRSGRADVVKLLLQDFRIDPTNRITGGYLCGLACRFDRIEVLRVLMIDERFLIECKLLRDTFKSFKRTNATVQLLLESF